MVVWSYSSIKTFDQCAKKYFHLKVAKDVKDSDTEHTVYGKDLHKAAEEFIKFGNELPNQFSFILPTLNTLKNIPGVKYCEVKLGVKKTTEGYEPCEFFDKEVWWRGIADLAIINGDKAYVVDYKTSKNAKYADTKQLDLIAGALFLHYPILTNIRSALAFVVCNEFVKKEHNVLEKTKYMEVFSRELDRLEGAMLSGVFNPTSGPLCGYCPVSSCEHWRERRR